MEEAPRALNPEVVGRMLAQYESMTHDRELGRLLRELMPEVDKVAEFAGAGRRAPACAAATPPTTPRRAHRYRITLSSAGPREDQIATLVHEMTHVLNYERYGQDVLSHLLVWSEQYGDPTSRFHALLTRLVEQTRDWRAAGSARGRFETASSVTHDTKSRRATGPDGILCAALRGDCGAKEN